MSKIIDAESQKHNHEFKRNGKYSFAPQTDKAVLNSIIDADAYQDVQLILMKRDRAALIDADALQAAALENRPKAQPEVIIA